MFTIVKKNYIYMWFLRPKQVLLEADKQNGGGWTVTGPGSQVPPMGPKSQVKGPR